MKKFVIIISFLVLVAMAFDLAYYKMGWYIDFHPREEVTTDIKVVGDEIRINKGKGYEKFEIKGVNMGSGEPGEWSTDFAVDKETYIRWFQKIKEMGANTLRIYTIQEDIFYEAFYEYNKDNPDPLYLIHGVWVNDYVQNSHLDAYDKKFYNTFMNDCKTMLDVIHGNKKISLGRMASAGSGTYTYDISQWVIGYILGVEWEDVTVAYTDDQFKDRAGYSSYEGEYMYTTEDASPFEAMLCRVGDKVLEYESKRYKTQKIIAFSNWPTTDPFEYPEKVKNFFMKCAYVDVEHIKTTDKVISGQFVSYHVYPYYPDYLEHVDDWTEFHIGEKSDYIASNGNPNTYKAYLKMLNNHHTMPVVISEFGVSTGRGMAQRDKNTGRNQGHMSEQEQGQALIDCYEDIMDTGCAGGCVFSWQDEWFKRTWNTMYAVDLTRTPYWSDYQTNEQYFGLLSFDPGKKKSKCYVDGDVSEWEDEDIVSKNDDMTLSMKYDEKFVYFMVHKKDLNLSENKVYIPLDITPKSGSYYCKENGLKMERPADFMLVLGDENESRLLVQERYEALRSTYAMEIDHSNAYIKGKIPDVDSPKFVNVDMMLQTFVLNNNGEATYEVYETGKLKYGNANPDSSDFDSLADYMVKGDYVEIKLPWQILNFADPSRMKIHDDYYDGNYGVEFMMIDKLYVGIADDKSEGRVSMKPLELEGWGNKVQYHERLKSSYYMLKDYWTEN